MKPIMVKIFNVRSSSKSFGANSFPKHIAGEASTTASPSVSVGDVVGQQNGSGNFPLFRLILQLFLFQEVRIF